jgi:hypothetical protein
MFRVDPVMVERMTYVSMVPPDCNITNLVKFKVSVNDLLAEEFEVMPACVKPFFTCDLETFQPAEGVQTTPPIPPLDRAFKFEGRHQEQVLLLPGDDRGVCF